MLDKFKITLNRTVPIEDPSYIVGEDQAEKSVDKLLKSLQFNSGVLGSVVLGQIGNGKTHFLRYIRNRYSIKENSFEGIYVPDMFVNGPLVDSINGIYKSFFSGPGNKPLTEYYNILEDYKKNNVLNETNKIMYLLKNCINESEEKLILQYFSGKELFPDELKYLKLKFGLKKSLINNELEFYDLTGNVLEFIQTITSKGILLLFDEVDKIYSADTNKVRMSAVQAKLLTVYRGLFDYLNNKKIRGAVIIGATPEAWNILSTQSAFERRFADNRITLTVPKNIESCKDFIKLRYKENNLDYEKEDEIYIAEHINGLSEDKRKTWAELITNLKRKETKTTEQKEDPISEILNILNNSLTPLTWKEIRERSEYLGRIYEKGQPTALLKKLEKENKIIINGTTPKTYENCAGELNEEF